MKFVESAVSEHRTRPFELAPGLTIGAQALVVFAGPCAIESEMQLLTTARAVKAAGAHVLRGGAFKPRTSPHSFQGLGPTGWRCCATPASRSACPPSPK
jgi:3-deoxy-7-phosphoheptulonate synthase